MREKDVITGWYKNLRKKYGAPRGQWTLWCKRPKTDEEREQVIIEAILTQRTNWRNVEFAVVALKKARLLSLGAFLKAYQKDPASTASFIKSSGFYQQKAERLAGLAAFIKKRYGGIAAMRKALASIAVSQGGPLAHVRAELLLLNGVGPETADSILLYALDKPIFVIDEYTRRFFNKIPAQAKVKKEGHLYNRSAVKTTFSPALPYGEIQQFFQKNLKKDYRLYQDFHALIVIDAKSQTKRYKYKIMSAIRNETNSAIA